MIYCTRAAHRRQH